MSPALLSLILSLAAALALISAGPGTRLGLWDFGIGFSLMRWALFMGLGAAGLALVLLIIPRTRRGPGRMLGFALILGLATAWVPWSNYQRVQALPLIHDITTDTENPPEFVEVVPLRAGARNPAEYPGEETAEQQRAAYPDIQPLELALSPDQASDQALQTARQLGWQIVAARPDDGRIEAVATTFWFGFEDDVVIRIAPTEAGSRLDIRSKSRVGRSDAGANAARIRRFVEAFEEGR